MKDPEDQQIKAEMEEISKNIDTILHRIHNLESGTFKDLTPREE